MSIGENIRQKREENGLSQKRLAEAIDSGENTLVGWEKDKNPPPGDKVAAMARLFGCSTDEILLEGKDRDITPEMRALFRRFGDLPDDMKHMARSAISALLATFEEEAARKTVA
ncbi:helix-turn-helix transcriptional regulator [Pseudomonas syringae pv. maculicola]|nr:helix-turn-helix transcriptional regulator [Pseudomonas syringae pv. maculicola]